MIFVYWLAIKFYGYAICIASLFNEKARAWCGGRKNYFKKIEKQYVPGRKTVWFHCASLGEFEQGRPVMESIKEKRPDTSIVVTFFSPSGYDIRKNYDKADHIFYLPLDTRRNAGKLLNIIQPDLTVFVKYEFWYFFLDSLNKRNIPVVLISAIFRPRQWFFRWYGRKFLYLLKEFRMIFVQDQDSYRLLKERHVDRVQVAGDTRFDRVISIAAGKKDILPAERLKGNRKIVVAGSTWREDEELLLHFINQKIRPYKWIIAPHEIYPSHLKWIAGKLTVSYMFYGDASRLNPENAEVLIIDNIGMLSSLYACGDVAYIGGGFGKGIHNILEAAVFGIPVIFGPNYNKFREARELIRLEGAVSIDSFDKLSETLITLFDHEPVRQRAGKVNKHFVNKSAGGTLQIVNNLLKFL